MSADLTPLLELRDLKVSYPLRGGLTGRPRRRFMAVNGVSLAIAPGETLGLVGESGCGKTTLARAITGLEAVASGDILLEGRPLTARRTPDERRQVQIVFQDPFSALNPRMTVLDLVTEAAVLQGRVPRAGRAALARSLLADVGLEGDILHRFPHAFSGGQRQRICIARALSLEPRLLVCDEPVSALDVSVQAQVINLLLDLQRARGLALLLISHDLAVVQHLAQRIAVMYGGRLMETGTTAEIMDHPVHPYTQLLLEAVQRIGEPVRPSAASASGQQAAAGCPFQARCPRCAAVCRETRPEPEPVGASATHGAACIRLPQSKIASGNPS